MSEILRPYQSKNELILPNQEKIAIPSNLEENIPGYGYGYILESYNPTNPEKPILIPLALAFSENGILASSLNRKSLSRRRFLGILGLGAGAGLIIPHLVGRELEAAHA